MSLDNGWRLRSLPRDRLEDLALRTALELRTLRRELSPNRHFAAVGTGFLLGAMFATAGFITGALLH